MKKVLFYLCFAPFIFLLLSAIVSSFTGTQGICIFGGCPKIYGFDAFWSTLTLSGIYLTILFPILPVCLFYIIFYLLRNATASQHPTTLSPKPPAKPQKESPRQSAKRHKNS